MSDAFQCRESQQPVLVGARDTTRKTRRKLRSNACKERELPVRRRLLLLLLHSHRARPGASRLLVSVGVGLVVLMIVIGIMLRRLHCSLLTG